MAEHRDDTWELVPDALLTVDGDGIIVDANPQALRLLDDPDMIGKSVETYVPANVRGTHAQRRDTFRTDPSQRAMGAGARLQFERPDGEQVPAHIALTPLAGDHVLVAIRDMSETARFERDLIEATRRRILAEDHERIARDLHDTIIQSLFALGMNLQAGLPTGDERQDERISSAVDSLDDVIRSIRDVIFDVRRSRVDVTSVQSRVVEVVASMIPSLGFEPVITVRGDLSDLSEDLIDHVLAVARESLSNVARHANATATAVDVIGTDDSVLIRVIDDGEGLPDHLDRHSGHANLADRAEMVHGRFDIHLGQQGGTVVEWEAPRAS
ncbi:MAG: histidine kinase [Actinomycetota bacterium]